jgi:hypothetical protein
VLRRRAASHRALADTREAEGKHGGAAVLRRYAAAWQEAADDLERRAAGSL